MQQNHFKGQESLLENYTQIRSQATQIGRRGPRDRQAYRDRSVGQGYQQRDVMRQSCMEKVRREHHAQASTQEETTGLEWIPGDWLSYGI